MNRIQRLLVVCLATALPVVVGGSAWAKSGPKPKKSNVVVLTDAQAANALLALADMPTGYAATPVQSNQPNATDGVCNGPNEAARAQTAGAAASGVVEFAQNPATGPFISESVYSFPTVAAAQSFVNATRGQVGSCTTYSSASSGTPINYSIAQVAFSKVADDTLAVRITTMQPQSTGSSGSADDIVVRAGNSTITLGQGALTGPDTSIEQQYVGKAVSKFGVALQAAKPSSTKTKKKK